MELLDETDVLIVGAGPAGATAALALATYGIRSRLITKYGWLSNSPRAHITNQRAGEVLRHLGVEEEVHRYAAPWTSMGDTLIATSLAGPEIARIRAWGTGDSRHGDYLTASPCPMLDVLQPDLEMALIRNAAERGTELSFHTEYVSHVQDETGVTTTLYDRRTGRSYSVRSKYLIGADGANSKVASDLGLPYEGEMGRQATIYARFRADLSRYVAHRPSILYWVASEAGARGDIGLGLLRAVRQWDEWIAGWGHDPSAPLPSASDSEVMATIRGFLGDEDIEITIENVSAWWVNEAFALSASAGRVFCAGDAIHRHPPSGGLGSNTSVQDAFNLAWKLAYVIKGVADPTILHSYDEERVPVARQVVERANRSRRDFAALQGTLRTAAESLPEALSLALRTPTQEAMNIRRALRQAVELKNYEFNALGVESNQRYTSCAVVESMAPVWERDPELYAQQAALPGAKLPHAWLVGTAGTRVSTLDLLPVGKFAVVTGLAGAAWWVEALSLLGTPETLTPVVIGETGAEDLYGEWARVSGLDENAMLLVRPDGYIAARVDPAPDSIPAAAQQLRDLLDTLYLRLEIAQEV